MKLLKASPPLREKVPEGGVPAMGNNANSPLISRLRATASPEGEAL